MSSRLAGPIWTIVAVAHDTGGAQAIAPVISKLRRRTDLRVIVIAGGFAQKVFARFRPENSLAEWPESKIEDFLDRTRADLLLSATSWKSALEQGFRNRARLRGIPSVVVIDFWSAYRQRWQHATYRFEDAPDQVCVMDRQTAQAINQEGYPMTQIHVTGHPHLERCYQREDRHPPASVAKREIAVLLLTIPLASLGVKEDPAVQIQTICKAAGQLHAKMGQPVSLTIRQHPHENPQPDLMARIREFMPPGVTVRLDDRTKPILGRLKKNDLVLGYSTMGLFEARSLGKQAIAIKLGDHPRELVQAMTAAGIPLVPLDSDHIADWLCHTRREEPNHTANPHRGATAE
ncbi:MAG: hypothetical protein JO170_26640, partial [Verrucomicrobia bacterium]|nr:hypothetical protein [Verrucomicrobiota bacterium]